ncbi:hypothetical protein P9D39_03440 [Heyndrickxia oleronia]|uniref:Uncharacterized protein n=1 Tax=Heyndrickxia oleronia TaxID=38875 RepID=A0A8E2I2Z7_9BACI|nr:hypothetical protein [Heyndrickxia oleronia]MEC1373364.1 hypothetical protein [Heyndrickxia oleronia]NYV63760.1 hypothetical protein [Bacillus sp. Gen3]OOP65789.1 hypothetical protein BWZ43_24375 [Heyndrickxia oleronia]QQZ04339.1 hypothetical protein I5818_22105 [Heyndrickxia oleronia]
MNFALFKFDNKNFHFQNSEKKKTWKLFSKKDDDVSLFNSTKISPKTYHIVFHISDEYIGGTKKGGEELKLPFSQYVNSFLTNNILFVENIQTNYVELIKKFIIDEYGETPRQIIFENNNFVEIIQRTNGFVKKLEYIDENDNDIEMESLEISELDKLENNWTIDYVNFLSNSTFLSLKKQGKLSINSNDEEKLLNIIEVISSAIY